MIAAAALTVAAAVLLGTVEWARMALRQRAWHRFLAGYQPCPDCTHMCPTERLFDCRTCDGTGQIYEAQR